ncbi:hypothetical protein RirG_169820 [Rhizophagus irregularis DAOM 197198w]|uniref:Uncharacterized protein n=1 Tax=Rhizophagus irregularis (strain DAOM 197198w) TaxID=1432141 RepID=A0A015J4C2_RHIIW|nr:hypothetical protein RirG_169820 [Rhizophagus irregularis DAOM 197198w]
MYLSILKYSTGDNESDITLKVILKKYVLWMKMLTKRSMIEEITAQINDIEGEIFDAKEEIATQINDAKNTYNIIWFKKTWSVGNSDYFYTCREHIIHKSFCA